ncbi:MAG: AsmA family protein [Woeseia sp.]
MSRAFVMGRVAKLLLIIIAGIVGIAVLASIALLLFFDPNDFRDEISAQVRDATGRELVIEGDLSLSVFPWVAVRVGSTRLGNAEGFGDEPFLSVAEAILSVRLMPLLIEQTISIGTASLDSLSLNLEVAANGRNNWDDLAEAAGQGPAADIEETNEGRALDIASVSLSNASISFRDAQAGTSNTVDGLTLSTGSITAGKPFDLEAEFDFGNEPAGVSGHLEFGGTVTLAGDKEQLSIRDSRFEGQLDGVAAETTEFRLSAPSVNVDMAAGRVSMGAMDLSLLGIDVSAEVEPTSYTNPRPGMTLQVRPFSLRELMRTLGVDAPPTADPEALERVSFSARAEVDESALALTSMTLVLDDTTLMGQLSLPLTERGAYRFDLNADSINLDRYMAPADAGVSGDSAATQNDIEIPADLIRPLKARGTVKIDRATLSGMTFENVVVGLNSADGKLRMHPISAGLFEGAYSGDVRINAAGDTPSISVNEKVAGVQLSQLARSMFGQENITGTIDGSFKLSGSGRNLAAIRRDLHGDMAFALANGTWQGTDVWHQLRSARALFNREAPPEPRSPARTEFTAVRASGAVTDGVFHNDDLLVELPFLRLTGNGSVDLAEGQIDYSMSARVLEQPEFIDPANATELADFTEAVIPLSITGPLASPSIKPDIETMARARLEHQVEKKGEEIKKRLIGELPGGSDEPPAEQPAEVVEPDAEPEETLEDALKKIFER